MNYFLYFILGGWMVAVTLGMIVIPKILLISYKKRLFDEPDKRKVHTLPVPRLGGLSFFPVILISLCLIMGIRYHLGFPLENLDANQVLCEFLFFAVGSMMLYLVGITDDLISLSYRLKFLVQILSGLLLVCPGEWINSLGGLFGIYEIPIFLGIPLTLFVVVYITNAINLIDGIDGLASGLCCISLVVLGTVCAVREEYIYSLLAFTTFGVLIPFWFYNVFGNAERARKIFMGDTGSLTLGYILSFLAIKYSQNNPEVISNTKGTFLIAFSTLIIPAFDVIRVVMVRLRNGKSPFEPDKNHIHHKFLAMGFTPRKAMIIIILISCAFSAVNILLIPWVNNTVILIGDIVAWIALNLWWDKVRDKRTHLNRLF